MPTVLLIITGGIAAYKSLELIRELGRRSITCRAVLTASAQRFVTPLSVAALTGRPVHTEMLDAHAETQFGHIELSRSADLVVVAPATAEFLAKAACGLADDLASTVLLATDKPVLMAPAMNVRMWLHPATQHNAQLLAARGITMIGPDDGPMACGEVGPGRMAEPPIIADAITRALQAPGPHARAGALTGRHIIVTAGPTVEPIDPVRFISNRSSGKQGYALAGALATLGARVTLVSGPVQIAPPAHPLVRVRAVQTARDMQAAVTESLPADAAICVAAVADFRPATTSDLKLDKSTQGASLALLPNPDILATLGALPPPPAGQRPRLVVGFAAQTHDVERYAQAKRERKRCDWIIANDVSGDVMGGDHNQVSIITQAGIERLARMPKAQVAADLAARIAQALTAP